MVEPREIWLEDAYMVGCADVLRRGASSGSTRILDKKYRAQRREVYCL